MNISWRTRILFVIEVNLFSKQRGDFLHKIMHIIDILL